MSRPVNASGRDQVEAGKCEAPVTFEYDDVVADVNRDAVRIEEILLD